MRRNVSEGRIAPTGVASRRTGVRAKAVVPLRAPNRLHRPQQALFELPTEHREGRRTAVAATRPPECAANGENVNVDRRQFAGIEISNCAQPMLTGRAVRARDPPQTQSGAPVAVQKGPYSISSSTRAMNDGDSVTPSARAVAGLIDKRNK